MSLMTVGPSKRSRIQKETKEDLLPALETWPLENPTKAGGISFDFNRPSFPFYPNTERWE
jgi:hypothetical protein